MKILIAEDEAVSRRLLESILKKWGYEVVVTTNGKEAWDVLSRNEAPQLAIIDWMMPEMDGPQVCQAVRKVAKSEATYIILLTAKGEKEDIVTGLNAGADDYVTKPFNREELLARLKVGVRIIELQESLAERVKALEEALRHVKQLQGMLPICSYCKKIRNDQNYWEQVEDYVTDHTEAIFSHSVCPECHEKHIKPQLEKLAEELDREK
jgi:DNA-binding response OmpR family regulator